MTEITRVAWDCKGRELRRLLFVRNVVEPGDVIGRVRPSCRISALVRTLLRGDEQEILVVFVDRKRSVPALVTGTIGCQGPEGDLWRANVIRVAQQQFPPVYYLDDPIASNTIRHINPVFDRIARDRAVDAGRRVHRSFERRGAGLLADQPEVADIDRICRVVEVVDL